MPTGVVPDAGHMTIGTGLDMAAKRCGSTLHDGMGSSAHVGGQGMVLLIGRKGGLEDRLERDERHRCLRTRGRRRSSGCVLQYHAHHPRDKRLVVRLQWRLISTVQVRVGVCHTSVAEGYCVTARWGGKQLEANPRSVGGRTRFGGMSRRAFDEVAKSETHGSRYRGGESDDLGTCRGWRWNEETVRRRT